MVYSNLWPVLSTNGMPQTVANTVVIHSDAEIDEQQPELELCKFSEEKYQHRL
jgi:hypothetical protein